MPIIPLFSHSQQALIAKDLQVVKQTPCGAFNVARSYFKKGD
jgi:hypothetical protein